MCVCVGGGGGGGGGGGDERLLCLLHKLKHSNRAKTDGVLPNITFKISNDARAAMPRDIGCNQISHSTLIYMLKEIEITAHSTSRHTTTRFLFVHRSILYPMEVRFQYTSRHTTTRFFLVHRSILYPMEVRFQYTS